MSLSTTFSCTVMYFCVMINQVLVQTFTAGEYNNGATLPESQLEQGGALVPLKF